MAVTKPATRRKPKRAIPWDPGPGLAPWQKGYKPRKETTKDAPEELVCAVQDTNEKLFAIDLTLEQIRDLIAAHLDGDEEEPPPAS